VFDSISLGNGSDGFKVRLATINSGNIEVRLDSPTGTLIRTLPVTSTGGWQNWNTLNCSITNTSGLKKVYLKFAGTASGGLFSFNWCKFI